MTANPFADMTTERLLWEYEVAIPHEIATTTHARRLARLRKDRAAIVAELVRRENRPS